MKRSSFIVSLFSIPAVLKVIESFEPKKKGLPYSTIKELSKKMVYSKGEWVMVVNKDTSDYLSSLLEIAKKTPFKIKDGKFI